MLLNLEASSPGSLAIDLIAGDDCKASEVCIDSRKVCTDDFAAIFTESV